MIRKHRPRLSALRSRASRRDMDNMTVYALDFQVFRRYLTSVLTHLTVTFGLKIGRLVLLDSYSSGEEN